MIMTSITWAGPRCVQELATFLGLQNRTQGRCDVDGISIFTLLAICLQTEQIKIRYETAKHQDDPNSYIHKL